MLIAHIAEHIALLYRQKMEAGIGMALPMLPNLRDPKFKFEDIDPQLDMMISQRAAEVVAKSPQMDAIAPLAKMMQQQQQSQEQQNPQLQYAQQLAALEAEALKARTEVQIQADQAKAQQKLAINQAEAKQDLQIEQAKLQADLQAKVQKLQLELQIEREKSLIKQQQEINNANRNNT
jgi:Fe-S cluster assembly iron-binding protein IscA